jgi:hypothetical protein
MRRVPVWQAAQAIRGKFLNLPSLVLSQDEVQCLFALDPLASEAVLAALIDVRFLTVTDDGRYVRRDRKRTAGGVRPRRDRSQHQPTLG